MPQDFADIVEPVVTLLIIAERRYGMKKSRSCRMKLQPRKRLRSPKIITKDVDPLTDLGIGLDGTMIMGPSCQPPPTPPNFSLEGISGKVIRILTTSDRIGILSEETTQITTIIGRMTTERDQNISGTKIDLGIGEVTITIHDRLQGQDRISLSRIFTDNPDQAHLILHCLTGLEIEARATIYPTTRNSQLPITVISQT